eukprot:GHVP01063668.1.p1 GENE.GHVP01063668.1~~GHVP01063668.1.p1  ORF type:complete len:446 (-),score=52.42 GHVP01063668.1:18-1355(-)
MFSFFINTIFRLLIIDGIVGSHTSSSRSILSRTNPSDDKSSEVKGFKDQAFGSSSSLEMSQRKESSSESASVSYGFIEELSVHDIPSPNPKKFVHREYILDKEIQAEYKRLHSELPTEKHTPHIIREYNKSALIIVRQLFINIRASKNFGERFKKNEITIHSGGKPIYLFGNKNTVNILGNNIKLIADGHENIIYDHGTGSNIVIGGNSHKSSLHLCSKHSEAILIGNESCAKVSGSNNSLVVEGRKCLINLTGNEHKIVLKTDYNSIRSEHINNANIEVVETGTKNTIRIGEGETGVMSAFIYLEGSGNNVISKSRIHGLINGRNNTLEMSAPRSKITVTGSMNKIKSERKCKAYLEKTATNNVLNLKSGLNAVRVSGKENTIGIEGEGSAISIREKSTNNTMNIYGKDNNIDLLGKQNSIILSSKRNEVKGEIKGNRVKYINK